MSGGRAAGWADEARLAVFARCADPRALNGSEYERHAHSLRRLAVRCRQTLTCCFCLKPYRAWPEFAARHAHFLLNQRRASRLNVNHAHILREILRQNPTRHAMSARNFAFTALCRGGLGADVVCWTGKGAGAWINRSSAACCASCAGSAGLRRSSSRSNSMCRRARCRAGRRAATCQS